MLTGVVDEKFVPRAVRVALAVRATRLAAEGTGHERRRGDGSLGNQSSLVALRVVAAVRTCFGWTWARVSVLGWARKASSRSRHSWILHTQRCAARGTRAGTLPVIRDGAARTKAANGK